MERNTVGYTIHRFNSFSDLESFILQEFAPCTARKISTPQCSLRLLVVLETGIRWSSLVTHFEGSRVFITQVPTPGLVERWNELFQVGLRSPNEELLFNLRAMTFSLMDCTEILGVAFDWFSWVAMEQLGAAGFFDEKDPSQITFKALLATQVAIRMNIGEVENFPLNEELIDILLDIPNLVDPPRPSILLVTIISTGEPEAKIVFTPHELGTEVFARADRTAICLSLPQQVDLLCRRLLGWLVPRENP